MLTINQVSAGQRAGLALGESVSANVVRAIVEAVEAERGRAISTDVPPSETNETDHSRIAAELEQTKLALNDLKRTINTPELHDFAIGVSLEASHQRLRFGDEHDSRKTPINWYFLICYLGGKACAAHLAGDIDTARHHTISTAAALNNWHAAISRDDSYQPNRSQARIDTDEIQSDSSTQLTEAIGEQFPFLKKIELAFWARRNVEGLFTGEVLPDSNIEVVRKASGSWIPLFAYVHSDGLHSKGMPTDLILFCPACGLQHIDRPEVKAHNPIGEGQGTSEGWTNPPHRSHLCHQCGNVWRPADVATNGVASIKTRGAKDSLPISMATPLRAQLDELVDIDALSNFIREIDGNNRMGAGALAENIANWLSAQVKGSSGASSFGGCRREHQ